MYTSPVISPASAATLEMTAPPYECPTSTTGPSRLRTRSLTAAASAATLRSGLAAAITVWPASSRGSMTPSQLDDSANAPCMRTMVGCIRGVLSIDWHHHRAWPPTRASGETPSPIPRHQTRDFPRCDECGPRATLRRMNATATNHTPSRPTAAERFEEVAPVIAYRRGAGPSVLLLVGPWLLLVLLLIPPAAVLITLFALVALPVVAVALVGALVASPFLLVRAIQR